MKVMKKLTALMLAILMATTCAIALTGCEGDTNTPGSSPGTQQTPSGGDTPTNDNGAQQTPSIADRDIPFYIYIDEDYKDKEEHYLDFLFGMPDAPQGYSLDIWVGRLHFQFGSPGGYGSYSRILDADTGELLSLYGAYSRAEGTEWSSSEIPYGISGGAFYQDTYGYIPIPEITLLPAGYELDLNAISTVRVEYGDERGITFSKDYDFKEILCSDRAEFWHAKWVAESAYTPPAQPRDGELVRVFISYAAGREGYDPATSSLDWWYESEKLAGFNSIDLTFAGNSEYYGLNISDAKIYIDGVGHDTEFIQTYGYTEYWLGRYDSESNSTIYGFMLPGAWDYDGPIDPGKIWFEFTCNGAELRTYSFDVRPDGTYSVIYDGTSLAVAAPTPPILANAIGTVDPNERGNTNGNIANGGRVATKDDWVYFIERSDLYKVRADGTGSEKILGGVSGGLNVVEDWLYYVAGGGLYRMRTGGTGITRVMSEQLGSVNIVGDWIYYSIAYSDSSLYKIRTDGTEGVKLGGGDNVELSHINVVGDWVYFLVYSLDGNGSIWRSGTDGTDRQKLEHPYSIECLIVDGDWIYYSDVTGCLYRTHADTMMKTKLIDADCGAFNISGDWIYYQDEYYDLCKIKIDGTGYETLSSHRVDDISIAGDWILFNTDYGLVGITSDGTDLRIDGWLEGS